VSLVEALADAVSSMSELEFSTRPESRSPRGSREVEWGEGEIRDVTLVKPDSTTSITEVIFGD
jgi:hypothetical protein